MASARASTFRDTGLDAIRDEDGHAIVSLVPTGRTTRDLPPQSPGLRAPAGVSERADQRRRDAHPGTPGPISAERAEGVVALVLGLADKLEACDIAAKVGLSTDGRAVKAIIKAARASLASRAEFYVQAHAVATIAAAADGDAKPAQWALERIADEGERVVDAPKQDAPAAAPTFNLGFMLGGMPMGAAPAQPPAGAITVVPVTRE